MDRVSLSIVARDQVVMLIRVLRTSAVPPTTQSRA